MNCWRTRLRAPRGRRLRRRPGPSYGYRRLTSVTSHLVGSTRTSAAIQVTHVTRPRFTRQREVPATCQFRPKGQTEACGCDRSVAPLRYWLRSRFVSAIQICDGLDTVGRVIVKVEPTPS